MKKLRLLLFLFFLFIFFISSEMEDESSVMISSGQNVLNNPYGLTIDESSDVLYIADTGNNQIRKFTLNGDYIDSFDLSSSEYGPLLQPQAVAVNPVNGMIYVADTGNHRIIIADKQYQVIKEFGSYGILDGQLRYPNDIATDSSGNIYICDSGNDRIVEFTINGEWVLNWGENSGLFDPHGIFIDEDDFIFVADSENHRVIKINRSNEIVLEIGEFGFSDGQLFLPADIAVDNEQNIYVADTENHRIQKFDQQGNFIKNYNDVFTLNSPQRVVVDSNHKIYVLDSQFNSLLIWNDLKFIYDFYVQPSSFSPNQDGFNDYAYIFYSITEPALISMMIYDSNNNLIRTLINNQFTTSLINSLIWNGKDNDGNLVSKGEYICKINAENNNYQNIPQKSSPIEVNYPNCQVSGTITDSEYPVYHAEISNGYQVVKSDLNGYFKLKYLSVGEHQLTVSKSGFDTVTQSIIFQNEDEIITDQNFTLHANAPRLAVFSGMITDINLEPIPEVSIYDGTREIFTDNNGTYILDNIPAGDISLIISKTGFEALKFVLNLKEGEVLLNKNFVLINSDTPKIVSDPDELFIEIKTEENVPSYDLSLETNSQTDAVSVQSSRSVVEKGPVIPGEYIIHYNGKNFKEVENQISQLDNIKIIKNNETLQMVLVECKDGMASPLQTVITEEESSNTVQQLNNQLNNENLIEFIEPNRKVTSLAAQMEEPDDEFYQEQWALKSIQIPEAWKIESGNPKLIVAVVDSGVDYDHPDLLGNYIADGYDFIDNDEDPYPESNLIDDDGDGLIDEGVDHGTHVAGIIAASTNNSIGISGIAQVNIIAIRILDSEGNGTSYAVAAGIAKAVEKGAKIINLSIGGGGTSVEELACQNAWDAGCILVGAVGNDYQSQVAYPAAYPSVIAVSALDVNDGITSFSNIGPQVEIAAPGKNIYSTVLGSHYKNLTGSSMAAPHVSGVAALIWSLNPDLDNKQVRYVIHEAALDLGQKGRDEYYGYGKIDAYKSLVFCSNRFAKQSFDIFNLGGEDLEIRSLTCSSGFLFTDVHSTTISPGKSETIYAYIDSSIMDKGVFYETISINNNDESSNPSTIPVTVIYENRRPEITEQADQTVAEGELLEFNIIAEDPDNDILNFSVLNLPEGAEFDSQSGLFSWQPSFDQAGLYNGIEFEVTDGEYSDNCSINITVNNVNRNPVMSQIGNKEMRVNEVLDFYVEAIDPDNDPLVFTASNLPENAVFDEASAHFRWEPEEDQIGEYNNIQFEVSDGQLMDNQVISILVREENLAPNIEVIEDQVVIENELLEFTVIASDPDNDVLSYSAENLPDGALLNALTGTFNWTPTHDQIGTYSDILVKVSDGKLFSDVQITITVRKKPLSIIKCDYLYDYEFGGDQQPFIQGDVTYDYDSALQFGNINDNQVSYFELFIEIPDSVTLSFNSMTSCEQDYDFLYLYINDDVAASWSGSDNKWILYNKKVNPGEYTIRWEYKKDYSNSVASDTAWISIIEITKSEPLDITQILQTDFKYVFQTGGESEPFIQNERTFEDNSSLQFGAVTHSQSSYLEITTTALKDTILTYNYKVSSEVNYDFLQFYIDGIKMKSWSGEIDWQEYTCFVPSGVHTLKWEYIKDKSVSSGIDTGWIAAINIIEKPAHLATPMNLSASDGEFYDKIVLQWDFVNNAESFDIYRSESASEGFSYMGNSLDSNFTDQNIVAGMGYYYKIQAYSSAIGYSELSAAESGFAQEEILINQYRLTDASSTSSVKSLYIDQSNDVYIAGYIEDNGSRKACYWKNGQLILMPQTETGQSVAYSIFVYQGDIYVAGYYSPENQNIACYWKNGQIQELSAPSDNQTYVKSIFIENDTVYAAGVNENGECVYWVNGVVSLLSSDNYASVVKSLFVYNGDIYVAGLVAFSDSIYFKACYWKNGVLNVLENDQDYSDYAEDIFVTANSVYVIGIMDGTAGYWKDGERINFNDSGARVNSIFVEKDDVYIGGYSYLKNTQYSAACYWKNGVKKNVTESISIANGYAVDAIFVKDNVIYSAGHYYENQHLNACYWMDGSAVK